MEKIYTYAKFVIPDGQAERFKALARTCFDSVRDNEPRTLFYEWFLNADETECVAIDCYDDMDALMAHVGNNKAAMSEILSFCERQLEIFGADPMAKIGGGKTTAGDDAFFGSRFLGKL